MTYEDELDRCFHIVYMVAELIKELRESDAHYPLTVAVITNLLYGVVPNIGLDCPACGKSIIVQPSVPVGGIIDLCDLLDQDLAVLQLEVDMEGGPCEQGENSQGQQEEPEAST